MRLENRPSVDERTGGVYLAWLTTNGLISAAGAAAISGRSVTDFSVSTLVREAADVIAHERDLYVTERALEAFNEAIERPARTVEGFAQLLKRRSVFVD